MVRDQAALHAPRPVLLVTLSVRVEPEAERMAIESALEANVPLVVVNVISPPPCPTTIIRLQEDLEAIRQTVERARTCGIPVQLETCVPAWRPLRTVLELARERDAGLVVLGADPQHARRRRLRRAARAIRDELDCLVWIPARADEEDALPVSSATR